MEKDKQAVLAFARQWNEAMVSNDADTIGTFMSDNWIIAGADGITTKQAFLQMIQSGDLTHNRMDSDEQHLNLFGDTAVLLSKGTSAGHYKGEAFSLYEWSTSVFIKKDMGWVCVHTMLVKVS